MSAKKAETETAPAKPRHARNAETDVTHAEPRGGQSRDSNRCHAEPRSTRREEKAASTPSSALSAPPRANLSGWQTVNLGEVCEFLNRGISPKYLEEGGVCVLNQKCVRDHRVSFDQSRRHDEKAKAVSPERFIREGDVLVNSTGTGTLGRVAQVREEPDEPTTVDSHVTIVRPKAGLFHSEFFGYMLVVIEDAIKEAGEGCGGQTELARSVLAERFSVSFPSSKAEQRRIVGILDEALAGIAAAKAHAERNRHNARALFESHLHAIFSHPGPSWVETTLGDALAVLRNGFNCKQDKSGKGTKVSRIESIWNAEFDITRVGFADIPDEAKDKFRLRIGDILFSHINSAVHVGKTAIFDSDEEVVHGVNLLLMRPKDGIRPQYLDLYLKSIFARGYWQGVCKQSVNQASVNQQDIGRVPFAYPHDHEQLKIVTQLDALAAETRRLEGLYERKAAALDELKQSLLHQAFSGQL